MLEIVERLADDFRVFAPEMLADPKVCLLRPFRDTRFSEDKTPLKTHVGATFPNRALGRMNGAGFYFEVAPAGVGRCGCPAAVQLPGSRCMVTGNLWRLGAPAGECS